MSTSGSVLPAMLNVVAMTMVRTRARIRAASVVVETLCASLISRSRRAMASRALSRALLLVAEYE